MKIDTRFPPQPPRIKVPLYPNQGKLVFYRRKNTLTKLAHLIADTLKTDIDHLLFSHSASNALYVLLSDHKKRTKLSTLRIALPSFNCSSLVDAITSAGCEPVFLDTNENFQIDQECIDFAVKNNCELFLWPNYFGTRKRNETLLQRLYDHDIKVIFDEAQTFPIGIKSILNQIEHYAYAVLISFGKNKATAGNGGGVLYSPKTKLINVRYNEQITRTNWSSYWNFCIAALAQKIKWRFTQLTIISNGKKHYKKLDTLLNHQAVEKHTGHKPIGEIDAATAYKNLNKLLALYDQQRLDYISFKNSFESKFSTLFDFLKHIEDFPSIMAVNVSSSSRYKVMKILSQNMIQTTWYYYPLDMLDSNKNYLSQSTKRSYAGAASVLILPFNWTHSFRQKNSVMKALDNALSVTMRSQIL